MSETTVRYCYYGGFKYPVYSGEKDPDLTLSEYIYFHGDDKFASWFRFSAEHARRLRYIRDKPTEKTIRELIDRTPLMRKNCLPPHNKKVLVKEHRRKRKSEPGQTVAG